jgi:general secretion pathway protein J
MAARSDESECRSRWDSAVQNKQRETSLSQTKLPVHNLVLVRELPLVRSLLTNGLFYRSLGLLVGCSTISVTLQTQIEIMNRHPRGGSPAAVSKGRTMVRGEAQSSDAGFTLLETLISILLMGIILAALGTITTHWLRSWNGGFERLQRVQLLSAGLDQLTDDLSEALFVSVVPGNSSPLFDGDDTSVTFVRTILAPNSGDGLQVVRIAQSSDDAGPTLVRSTAPLAGGTREVAGAEALVFVNPVVVMRSPYRVSFSYAGPDRLWRDRWQNQLMLPRAIRIQVRDDATSTLLTSTTSTLVYTELPASCTWTGVGTNCAVITSPTPFIPLSNAANAIR